MSIFYRAKDNNGIAYIQHDGVIGMKWGKRRYQNEDGTWTEEGLERRRAMYKSSSKGKAAKVARVANTVAGIGTAAGAIGVATAATLNNKGSLEKAIKPGKDGKPSLYEKTLNKSSDIIGETNKLDNVLSRDSQDLADINDLSNAELRDMIGRMQLEKQFRDLSSSDIKRGSDTVKDVLEVAGSLATIGLSVAGIATAIHQIRN